MTRRRKRTLSSPVSMNRRVGSPPTSFKREDGARLRERFDDQHPGHHRMPREVPREIRFVESDVLDRYDAALDQLDDAIDEQKRIAMGQEAQHPLKL